MQECSLPKKIRSIGLCNSQYKIITKIITSRLKPLRQSIIGPYQASFLTKRIACDNAIIFQEYLDHFKRMRGKKANMILNIDLEKAFDILEWSFIRQALVFFNLSTGPSKLIIFSISTSSISVLVNGNTTPSFKPTRGIRQGDPMSPYMFILCMELLLRKINYEIDTLQWSPFP